MNNIIKKLLGVFIFLLTLIGVEIYFFYSFLTHGLFVKYGYSLGSLSAFYITIFIFLFIVVFMTVGVIFYGFIKQRKWVRKFSIFFLLWSMLWPIWGILIWSYVLEQIFLLLIYSILIMFLLSSYARDYFKNIFHYGKYTLYKREVILKSGKKLIIYFFSEHVPKSGVPTAMPVGYVVKVNPRSKMPYLEKHHPNVYKYGKYTLYKRIVTLKSGKTLTIYFFSEHKPKSGVPASMPNGYVVEINARSKMPYLKKV